MSEAAKECPFLGQGNFDVPYYISESNFEVMMDKLASEVGLLYAFMAEDSSFFCMTERNYLEEIAEKLYHLSTALRDDYSLTDEETEAIIQIGHRFDKDIPHYLVLPVSQDRVGAQAHVVRASCREVIVFLRKLDQYSHDAILHDSTAVPKVDQRLYDVFDSLANYFFGVAIHCSEEKGLIKFVSRTY